MNNPTPPGRPSDVPASAADQERFSAATAQDAAVFGRPAGVEGGFARPGEVPPQTPAPQIANPDPVLKEAFARRPEDTESLQPDPLATYDEPEPEPQPDDPWRDTASVARLGDPAVVTPPPAAPTIPARKLSARELLGGKGISWVALTVLVVVALLIGLLGGLIGRYTAELTPALQKADFTLHNVEGDSPQTDAEAVADAVAPSVVTIDVRTDTMGGTGSGVFLDNNGYIVTNNHVIALKANTPGATLSIVTNDDQTIPARIVGRDPHTDLAVIKVDNVKNILPAQLGDSDKLRIGEDVIAFGSPLGLRKSVTTGIVSAVHRPVPLTPDDISDTDAVLDAIQTDASINHGNSGGPLVDMKGRVIGINSAGIDGAPGLNFAIPVNEMKTVAESLIRTGVMHHAQIGVNASSVQNDKVLGALIKNVVANSPAARAGLRNGDVITEFNGKSVEDADTLTVLVRTAQIGKEVSFTYWRDGRTFDGKITPLSD